jgi:hypothetical protein
MHTYKCQSERSDVSSVIQSQIYSRLDLENSSRSSPNGSTNKYGLVGEFIDTELSSNWGHTSKKHPMQDVVRTNCILMVNYVFIIQN